MLLVREEHRGLLILSERAVFSVFNNADDFCALSTPVLEMAADGFLHRSENLGGKVPIDDRHLGRLAVVVDGEISAGQQLGARCLQIARRYVVVHGIGGVVGGPEIGGAVAINVRVAPAQAERNIACITHVSDARNCRKRFDHALLHLRYLLVGVAGHAQIASQQASRPGAGIRNCFRGIAPVRAPPPATK